jgi:hypothetical protein
MRTRVTPKCQPRAPAGGIAVTRTLLLPNANESGPQSAAWIWPLTALTGVAPVVIEASRAAEKQRPIALGYPYGTFAQNFIPVVATHGGIVTYAARGDSGAMISLDHPGGWSTQYEGLADLSVFATDRFLGRRSARMQAGEVLGHLSQSSPTMRFSLSRLTDLGMMAIDPAQYLHTWSILPCPSSSPRSCKPRAA